MGVQRTGPAHTAAPPGLPPCGLPGFCVPRRSEPPKNRENPKDYRGPLATLEPGRERKWPYRLLEPIGTAYTYQGLCCRAYAKPGSNGTHALEAVFWRSCVFMRVNFSKTSSPVAYYGEDPAPEITTSPLPAQKPGKTGRNSEKMHISGPKHPLFGPEPHFSPDTHNMCRGESALQVSGRHIGHYTCNV